MTTEATWRVLQDAIEAGASGYVPKPFTPEMMRQKVAHVLQPEEGQA